MFSTHPKRLLLFSRDCYRALSTAAPRNLEPVNNILLLTKEGCSTRDAIRDGIAAVLKQFSDHQAAVRRWKTIATTVKSTEGVDLLWEHIFVDKESLRTSGLIDEVLTFSRQLENPSDTIAQLVCSLIRVGRSDLARKIALKTSIAGYRLSKPLETLKEQGDLASVEKVAHILSETTVAELHKWKRSTGDTKTKEHALPPEEDEKALLGAVSHFIGEKSRRPKRRYRKQKKLKRHRVKESALFQVLEQIRDAWYGLAEDEASRKRCHQWCSRNGVRSLPTNS